VTSPDCRPIGVFDSGIGGLSVLHALRMELPHECFVYLADSANAPYGDARGEAFVLKRSLAIAHSLRRQYHIKSLVIACNTATAAAIDTVRAAMPDLPVVGVEPALAPAARHSRTHGVGVLATRSTLESPRFQRLLTTHGKGTRFVLQACDGLAQAIENHVATRGVSKATEVRQLCTRYITALGRLGGQTREIDSLVLGCTHYALVQDLWATLAGPAVQIWSCGDAVARQTRRVLEQIHLLAAPAALNGDTLLHTTGRLAALEAAAKHCLPFDFQCVEANSI